MGLLGHCTYGDIHPIFMTFLVQNSFADSDTGKLISKSDDLGNIVIQFS